MRSEETGPDLGSYDRIVPCVSGGKDSCAIVAHLLERGVPKERIELAHHLVDGAEGSTLMDWPATTAYVRAFARELGLKLTMSWREGGFEREMTRRGQPTAAVVFEDDNGDVHRSGGDSAKLNTRMKYPQVSSDLSVRWCSAYLKIDVLGVAINNQPRFNGSRTLVVTGERAEESAARARYATLEPHRTDRRHGRLKRHVDHWRPIHGWAESEVWAIMARHGIRPHPAYEAGFGRVSCATCIFCSSSQLATIAEHAPTMIARQANYERAFGKTIHRTKSVIERVAEGTPYAAATPERMRACLSDDAGGPVLIDPAAWMLPAGAYGESAGPT